MWSVVVIPISEPSNRASREKNDNDFHEHDIGQDHEQRGQHYRTGGRTAYTLGASPRSHSLKTSDQPNDHAEHSGLERGWQEIVETGACKAVVDELAQGDWLNQRQRNPSQYQTA